MRTLLISTLAVGLIGCASKPQVVMRIVDPYSYSVYELTNAPCPRSGTYPLVFAYQGAIQGCYRVSERNQAMYFLSSHDWQTRVTYTYAQLVEAKRVYESSLGYVMQTVRPSYAPTVPYQSTQPAPSPSTLQCFGNGFGTVTCN
jgi:hypothetical protein